MEKINYWRIWISSVGNCPILPVLSLIRRIGCAPDHGKLTNVTMVANKSIPCGSRSPVFLIGFTCSFQQPVEQTICLTVLCRSIYWKSISPWQRSKPERFRLIFDYVFPTIVGCLSSPELAALSISLFWAGVVVSPFPMENQYARLYFMIARFSPLLPIFPTPL